MRVSLVVVSVKAEVWEPDRRRCHCSANSRRRIRDYPRVGKRHTGQSGRSLFEGLQLW